MNPKADLLVLFSYTFFVLHFTWYFSFTQIFTWNLHLVGNEWPWHGQQFFLSKHILHKIHLLYFPLLGILCFSMVNSGSEIQIIFIINWDSFWIFIYFFSRVRYFTWMQKWKCHLCLMTLLLLLSRFSHVWICATP